MSNPAAADLVHQTTTDTGAGNLTLSAVNGKQSFNGAFGNGSATNVFRYYISNQDAAEWERGLGHMSSTTTLVRDTIEAGTNGTSAVVFSAGTKNVVNDVPAEKQSIDSVGMVEWWPTSELKSGRLKANGASVSRTTYADLAAYLVKSKTVTFTNASSDIGCTAHGFSVGDPVKLFTTGTLPTNFTAGTHGLATVGTVYYVISAGLTANVFRVATSAGGTAVSAGSAGSGTHTAVVAPHGDGDGSTTFTLPELRGEHLRAWDDGRAVDTNRVIGSAQLDAMQGHFHSNTVTNSGAMINGGGGPEGSSSASQVRFITPATVSVAIGAATTDGTNGTPRTAAETRGRNVALMATVRYV